MERKLLPGFQMLKLTGDSSVQDRLRAIFLATRTHAFNLAKFVAVYKTVLLLQRKTNAGKERSLDTFVAGLLGGYLVFGTRTAINEQVRFTWIQPRLEYPFCYR